MGTLTSLKIPGDGDISGCLTVNLRITGGVMTGGTNATGAGGTKEGGVGILYAIYQKTRQKQRQEKKDGDAQYHKTLLSIAVP